mmetsp:Transcript_49626/g.130536  ORF Transcript_49626/g.130536 Transcript_49626/m.130536 type:complete len:270 (+) Transcript_49626:2-811(+)
MGADKGKEGEGGKGGEGGSAARLVVLVLALVVVAVLLLVGALGLLERLGQRRLLLGAHRRRRHLDVDLALARHNILLDLVQRAGKQRDAEVLVQRVTRHHVQGRRDEADVDGVGLGTALDALEQRGLDGVDALVREARHLEVRPHLDGLRGEAQLDVLDERRLDVLAHVELVQDGGVRQQPLEGVEDVAELVAQLEAEGLVQVQHVAPLRSRQVAHDAVSGLGLVELVLDLRDIFRRHPALGKIDVALLLVNTQHERDLLSAHIDQLLD